MKTVTLPDGKVIKIPDNLDPEKRAELAAAVSRQYDGFSIDETTILGQAKETLKGVPRGALSMVADVPLGVASLFDIGNDSDLVQGLQQYKDFLRTESSLAADPAYADKWMTKFGEGLGSFGPFLGAGAIGKTLLTRGVGSSASMVRNPMFLAPASIAAPAGIAQQVDRMNMAKEQGEDVGALAETFAELGGGIIGLSEVLPVFKLLERVPINAQKYMDIRGALDSAVRSGGIEALQEVTASLSQDLLARGLYSDELPIGESLFDEFTIGGAVGAFADLAVNAVSGRTKSRAYIREKEKIARDNVASTIEENKFQKAIDQGDVEVAQDQPIGDKPNEITLPADADIIPSLEVIEDANGAFNVVDATDPENPIVQTFAQETEALVFKDKQENNYQRKITKNEVDQAKYNLGLPESSVATVIGSTIRDPNIGEINLSSIIDNDTTLSEEQKKVLRKERTDTFGPNKKAFSQARVARLGPKLNKIGKYVQSKGLDLKSNYSMAETQKILNKKDYTNLLKDTANTLFTQSEEAGIASIRADKKQVNTSIKAMKDLAASKNIDLDFKSPAVRYAALRWTGTENITKAGKPAKELFLARIHSIRDPFSTETKFPDFRPREYTAIDVANFVASKASQNAEFTVKELLSEETSPTYKNKTATEQFINDLTTSGRAEKVEGTNKYKIRKNFQYDIARRSEPFNETPDEYEARLRQENKVPEDVIQTLVEKARENQKGTLPPKEIEPKIINFAEAVEQGKINKFAQEAKKILNEKGLKETAIVIGDDILSTTTLAEDASGNIIYDPRITRATTTEGAIEGEYDVSTDTIFLSLNAVNPDGTASQEEIENRLMQVLDHEMIHAFRAKDLITESEYQYLKKQVKRAKVPKSYDAQFEGQTFYDRAIALNSKTVENRGKEFKEEFFLEEAIAEMYRARNFKVQMPPKAEGIFNKMVEFFRSMGQAMRTSGFKRTSQIFSEIESGKVGSRERGVIRTLMQTDRLPPSAFDEEQAVEVEDEIGTEEDIDNEPVDMGEVIQSGVLVTPTTTFADTDSDTNPVTGIFVDPNKKGAGPTSGGKLYNARNMTRQELMAERDMIIDALGTESIDSIEALDWIIENAPSKDYKTIAQRLQTQIKRLSKRGKTPINMQFHIINKGTNRLPLRNHKGRKIYPGVSYPPFQYGGEFRQQIYISNVKDVDPEVRYNANGVNFETILHEFVHQATQTATYVSNDVKTKEFVSSLETIRSRIRTEIKQRKLKGEEIDFYTNYGVKNVQELLAVGLTDRKFQEFMESIPYTKQGKKSVWDKFTESLRKLLNIPAKQNTVFSEFLLQAGRITNLSAEQVSAATDLGGGDFVDIEPDAITTPTDERIESLNVVIYGLQRQLDLDTMSANTRDRISRQIYKLQDEVINLERSQEVEVSGQVPLFSRTTKTQQNPYEVLSKIDGKSLTEVMDIIAKEDKDLSIIAKKVKEQIIKFEKQGYAYSLNTLSSMMPTGGRRYGELTPKTQELIDTNEDAKRVYMTKFADNPKAVMGITSMPDPIVKETRGGKLVRPVDIFLNNINGETRGLTYRTILHEAIHGVTVPLLEAGAVLSKRGNPFAKKATKSFEDFKRIQEKIKDHVDKKQQEMNEVYQEGRKEWGDRLDRTGYLKSKGYSDFEINSNLLPIYPDVDQRVGYDLEALVELVTYGLTDIKTQEFMETIPYSPQGKKTVWNEFVETIRKILGVPAKQDTVLSEILRAGEDVLSVGPVAINNALNEYRSERGRTYLQQGNRFATEANTSENIKLREAVDRAEEIVKQTPRGEIPIYNINASDVALKAAIEFNEDITAPTPSKNVPLFSRASIPSEFNDLVKRTGKSPEPTQPYGVRLLDVINNPIENIRKAFKDTRQNIIDKLDKTDKKIIAGKTTEWYLGIDERTGKRRINRKTKQVWTPEEAAAAAEKVMLANNSAATGTMAALRFGDRARGVFQSMLMVGTPTDKIEGDDSLTFVEAHELDAKYNPFLSPEKKDTIDPNTGRVIKKAGKYYGGLMQIMAPLYANPNVNLEEVFGIYAKLKRVQKLQQEGREFETPITPKDLEQIRVIETKYKSVVEAWNNYQNWNNKLITFAKEKDLLSAEQAELWKEQSSYYPFYKEMVDDEGISAPTIGGGSLPSNPLNIEMKGSQREINVNPIEAISRNSLSILTAAMKNDGTAKLLNDLETMSEARRVSPREKKEGKLNTIFSFENGQKQYWVVEDVELFHGIQAIGGVKTDAVTRFLAFPSAILRDTVTRDPGFVVVNLLRDTLSAAVTSGAPLGFREDGFTPIIDTVKNMFADMSDLEKFGVVGGYDFQNDEGSVKQLMDRARRQKGLSPDNGMNAEDAFYKLWDGLGALTTKSDGATRLAVYNAVYNDMKKRGSSEAEAQSEAAYQALEIINFGRRGLSPMFRVVTSAIPFMNARIQGLDVLYRSMSGQYSATDRLQENETLNDVKNRIQRKFALRASAMIAATALYYLLVSDTDEYKEVKREVRDDNWIIPMPFGLPAIKIPIPFEVGMLFKAIPERLIDATIGRGVEKDPAKSIRRQIGTSANIPFFEPSLGIQAVKPIVEVIINRNSFTNSEIVPYYQSKTDPFMQTRQSTNELARLIGEAMNISPIKIEHVVNGYTGTLGGYVLDIIDVFTRSMTGTPLIPPNINDIPVLKRLFIDMDKSGGLQQQFYELRSEVERATATLNKLKDQKRYDELTAYREHNKGVFQVKSQVNAINRYMANYRKRRDRIMQRTDISMSAKSDMIRELELDRDRRLAIVPALREKADVPMISLGN